MLLKRRTTQNIVWGGLAGCFPALIGWTAVTGELAWAPVVLFAGRLLLDAAAHLGAGAALPRGLRRRRRADAAGGRAGRARSAARSSLYSWVMVATSLLLWPVADTGLVYPVAAAVLGAVFLVEAHRMWGARPGHRGPQRDPADAAVPRLEPLPLAAVRRGRARPAAHPLTRRAAASAEDSAAARQPNTPTVRLYQVRRLACPRGCRPIVVHFRARSAPVPRRSVAAVATRAGAGSRTRTSSQVARRDDQRRAEHVEPTSTTGRSVKYCTKPTAPWADLDGEQHQRRATGRRPGAGRRQREAAGRR